MEEERKEYLRKLQISKIQPNGSYMITDKKGNIVSMGKLTVEEIRYLRWYHRDPEIANKVVVPVNTNKQPSANVQTKKPTKKKFVVTRDQKYNKGGYKFQDTMEFVGKVVFIFGLVVVLAVGSFTDAFKPKTPKPEPDGAYISSGMIDEDDEKHMDIPTNPDVDIEIDVDYQQQVGRAEFIRILCQIFQVDYQTTYSKLVEMTDDFTDSEYLAGRHPLVSCKGMQIDADCEEEFLVYAVRVIAQDPNRVDLTKEEVCINDGYTSGDNYKEIIAKWAGILDVDPALVYGIIQAETGWNSKLFIQDNNPAGLKDGGKFWVFKNKEAGIIELMLEIVKYRYMGADTIEEIAAIHCPLDDPEDVNGLNKNWVRNVTNGYEQGRKIFEEMGFYKNNGLSY